MYTIIEANFGSSAPYPTVYRIVEVGPDGALNEVCLLSDKAEAETFTQALNTQS